MSITQALIDRTLTVKSFDAFDELRRLSETVKGQEIVIRSLERCVARAEGDNWDGAEHLP